MLHTCETCEYFDGNICTLENEPKDLDMTCKEWKNEEVSEN